MAIEMPAKAAVRQSTGTLAKAKMHVAKGEASCIVLQNGRVVYSASGRGVKPLLHLVENQPQLMRGAQLADKIIGKGAAMLAHLGGVEYVYGEVMSEFAREYLESNGIRCEFGTLVDVLKDRAGTGICPIEKAVFEETNAQKGYTLIKQTVARLMAAQ